MRDMPISVTVSSYSLLSCPSPICNLCHMSGPVGIWVCDPCPGIRASSRQRPRPVIEGQQFIQPIPGPATHSMSTNITIRSPAAGQSQKSSPKSSGGARHMAALRREGRKGRGSSAFEGGQCKQQVSISSVSKAPLNLTIETVTQVN